MKRLLALGLAFLLQQGFSVPHAPRPINSASTPTFKAYTYVVTTSSTSVSSITSPSISVAANDLVEVVCSAAHTSLTGITASSSGGGYTWTQRTLNSYNPGASGTYQQTSWTVVPSSASVTYTCTPNASSAFQMMLVLDFSNTGTTVETGVGGNTATTLTPTSSTFSTTQRTLIVYCLSMTAGSTAGTWSAGMIAGSASTLNAVNGATLVTTAQMGCESYLATSAVTTQTAAATVTTSTRYIYDVVPINY